MPVEMKFNSMLDIVEPVTGEGLSVPSQSAQYAEFPISEYVRRYARLVALMEARELDAILVTQEENVRYFTGYLSILWCSKFRPYVAVLPRDPSMGPTLVVPGQETGNAKYTSWVNDQYIYPDQADPVPHILKVLDEKGIRGAVGTELGFGMRLGMNVQQFEALRQGYPGTVVDGTPLIQTVRMIKSPAEVERLRQACHISQVATKAGFEAAKPGMTEKELLAIICSAMYAAGAEPGTKPSFFSITTGGNYTMVNALAKDYALQRGDFIMIDAGAVYGGYSTDYIRQACLGRPTDEQKEYYDIAVEANDASIAALKPGVTGADVYEAGMNVFKKRGVFEYNVLNIVGHGVGMDVHEAPWLGERDVVYASDTILRAGMVVCIEPVYAGYNDPEWKKGIWIQEDKVHVTDSGPEVLTDEISKDIWVA
jgi:Xaa-Pro dipeptidase